MSKRSDIAGQKFNRLTVLSFAEVRKRQTFWLCKCDCGNEVTVCGTHLKNGNTKSCGCLNNEKRSKRLIKHGFRYIPEYKNWMAMKSRCYNPNTVDYKYYGGRGIKVCEEWLNSFETFYKDMGSKPTPKHTVDRIDSNKNYSKENCRWATHLQQMSNTSYSKKVINTKTNEIFETIRQAADSVSMKKNTLYSQLSGKVLNKTDFKLL